jgi:2-polyprenyl-3-methyl-5-hydroxy-6-metoxy-1,4-benzoquinol methylase
MVIAKKKTIKTSCFCKNKNIIKNILGYDTRPLGETDFKIKNSKYKRFYSKCEYCNHYFANHSFDLEKLYKKNYSIFTYGSQKKMLKTFEKINSLSKSKSDNKSRVKRILKNIKKNFNCLDIGSGLGIFPHALQEKNFKVTCLEKDKNLKAHLKSIKLKVINDKILYQKKHNKYDFISMNKIIEHIEVPKIFLKKVVKLLERQGYLYIEVPSISALKSKLGHNSEEFFIEHFHVFSKKSLEFLITSIKLKIIYIKDIKENSGKYTLIALAKKNEN